MWWLPYAALGLLVLSVAFAKDICCGRPLRCICCFARHQNPRHARPFLLRNTGSLPADPAACDAALGKILHGHQHQVRQYGRWSNAALANIQARRYVPSRIMTVPEYFCSVRDGSALRNGLYWAIFSGSEEMEAETTTEKDRIFSPRATAAETPDNAALQRALRQLVGLGAAEAQLGVTWSANEKKPRPLSLWWGPVGHTEQLHYDGYANIHFQLRGQKTWRLFPPHHDLAPVSCVNTGLHGGHNFSTIRLPAKANSSVFAPDEHNATLCAALADEITITVRPGEAIYVPAGWWHQVSSSGPNTAAEYVASVNAFAPSTATPWPTRVSWHLLRLKLGNILLHIKDYMTNEVPTVTMPQSRV